MVSRSQYASLKTLAFAKLIELYIKDQSWLSLRMQSLFLLIELVTTTFVHIASYHQIPSAHLMPSDTSILKFPLSVVTYLHPRYRQTRDWTYRQAVANTILKLFLHTFTAFHMRPSLLLKPRRECDRFILIQPADLQPADQEIYKGIVVEDNVKPEMIEGIWYPKPFPLIPFCPKVNISYYSFMAGHTY